MPRQQKQMEFLVQGDMKTIMSRRFPPLPIVINYDSCRLLRRGLNARDIDRMVEAFRRPDRIRGIALDTISTPDFDKLFEVAKSPLPALRASNFAMPTENWISQPHFSARDQIIRN